jgi:hypothetical protein
MLIQLNFENPYEISPLPLPDEIYIFFRLSNILLNVEPLNVSYTNITWHN